MTSKEEFSHYVQLLGLADDRSALTALTGIHRSITHKYLAEDTTSKVVNVPQSAVSLVKLLLLVKTRAPDVFVEWATLMQCSPETFEKALPDASEYKKILDLGVLKLDAFRLLKEDAQKKS